MSFKQRENLKSFIFEFDYFSIHLQPTMRNQLTPHSYVVCLVNNCNLQNWPINIITWNIHCFVRLPNVSYFLGIRLLIYIWSNEYPILAEIPVGWSGLYIFIALPSTLMWFTEPLFVLPTILQNSRSVRNQTFKHQTEYLKMLS